MFDKKSGQVIKMLRCGFVGKKKSQSIIEYVLLTAIAIIALLAANNTLFNDPDNEGALRKAFTEHFAAMKDKVCSEPKSY